MQANLNENNIYIDGSCLKNPGKGGSAMIQLINEKRVIVFSEHFQETTNNRCELSALILALNINIKNKIIFSDSLYVVNGYNNWIHNWVRNNWKNSQKHDVLNSDLWKEILQLKNINSDTTIKWVKAHYINKYNNLCDKFAKEAANNITYNGKEFDI